MTSRGPPPPSRWDTGRPRRPPPSAPPPPPLLPPSSLPPPPPSASSSSSSSSSSLPRDSYDERRRRDERDDLRGPSLPFSGSSGSGRPPRFYSPPPGRPPGPSTGHGFRGTSPTLPPPYYRDHTRPSGAHGSFDGDVEERRSARDFDRMRTTRRPPPPPPPSSRHSYGHRNSHSPGHTSRALSPPPSPPPSLSLPHTTPSPRESGPPSASHHYAYSAPPSVPSTPPPRFTSPTPPPYSVDPTLTMEHASTLPKRARLGWGEGLVALEKRKDEPTETSRSSSPLPPPSLPPPPPLHSTTTAIPLSPLIKREVHDDCAPYDPMRDAWSRPSDPRERPVDTTDNSTTSTAVENRPFDPTIDYASPVELPALPTKEEVLQAIERMDADVAKLEQEIENAQACVSNPALQKKEPEPESESLPELPPVEAPPLSETTPHFSKRSLVRQIYEENRKTVSHVERDMKIRFPLQTGQSSPEVPLYLRPHDLDLWKQNLTAHEKMRGRLFDVLVQRSRARAQKTRALAVEYRERWSEWKRRIRLRKVKEEEETLDVGREYTGRVGITGKRNLGDGYLLGTRDTARTEAEFERIMLQLQEEDKRRAGTRYLHTLATVPPMIIDERQRQEFFINRNGLIHDPMAEERARKMRNPWTEEEKSMFQEKFLVHPKNFRRIANYLPNKTVHDVVVYYYLNKMSMKKVLSVRKGRIRKSIIHEGPVSSHRAVPRELQNLGVTSGLLTTSDNHGRSSRSRPSSEADNLIDDSGPEHGKWSEDEQAAFKMALLKFGTDFKAIAEFIGTKNQFQVKNYYSESPRARTPSMGGDDSRGTLSSSDTKREKKATKGDKTKKRERGTDGPSKGKKSGKKDDDDEKKEGKKRVVSYWTQLEKGDFKRFFAIHGRNWKELARLIPSKSETQIRNYFQNSRSRLGLAALGVSDERAPKKMKKEEYDFPHSD
eukprot:TRINITY_DN3399_c0_g1_i2.p1 TRINITY_DN3399_c0_g1~~TRINITY_DN3399_c0_g1_i2.p1  ORF type:complete len:944 (+),score=202.18 TRINITY_DN3399_c0_g1_i2:70-2901(+)